MKNSVRWCALVMTASIWGCVGRDQPPSEHEGGMDAGVRDVDPRETEPRDGRPPRRVMEDEPDNPQRDNNTVDDPAMEGPPFGEHDCPCIDEDEVGDGDDAGLDDDAGVDEGELPEGIRYGGGDGLSCADAVVVLGATGSLGGVAAEYAWIDDRYGDFDFVMQALIGNACGYWDVVRIRLPDGTLLDLYFDIEDFFGFPSQ